MGFLAQLSRDEGAPPGALPQSQGRGDDLYPISTQAVASFLVDKPGFVADAVNGIVNVLNYLALYANGTPLPDYVESRDLTQAQRACVKLEHLNQDSTLTPHLGSLPRL